MVDKKMIESDEKGIFFCYEAALALIPVIIILFTVAHINMDYTGPIHEKVLFQQVHDTVDVMSIGEGIDNPSIFEQISYSLSKNHLETAKKIANSWLKDALGDKKYRLIEINHLNGEEICSNGNIDDADNVAVAVKCQGSYMYKLFLGD